jgi:hypothetical protein
MICCDISDGRDSIGERACSTLSAGSGSGHMESGAGVLPKCRKSDLMARAIPMVGTALSSEECAQTLGGDAKERTSWTRTGRPDLERDLQSITSVEVEVCVILKLWSVP